MMKTLRRYFRERDAAVFMAIGLAASLSGLWAFEILGFTDRSSRSSFYRYATYLYTVIGPLVWLWDIYYWRRQNDLNAGPKADGDREE